jgi:hypothetical protein
MFVDGAMETVLTPQNVFLEMITELIVLAIVFLTGSSLTRDAQFQVKLEQEVLEMLPENQIINSSILNIPALKSELTPYKLKCKINKLKSDWDLKELNKTYR